MRTRLFPTVLVVASLVAASTGRAAGDEDPVLDGVRLSKLVESFKAEANEEAKSKIAMTIGKGRARSAPAVPVLASALSDERLIVRLNVAAALGMIGPAAKAAVPELTGALKDKAPLVREGAAVALGQIGPAAKAAAPELSDLVKEKSQPAGVRSASARALGALKAKEAVPLLTEAANGGEGGLRVAAAVALYAIDKENAKVAIPVLRDVLKGADDRARTAAVTALGYFGPNAKVAVPDLLAVMAKGGMSGYYAKSTLGKMKGAEPALVAALKDPDPKVQQAAAAVLKEYHPAAAREAGLLPK